MFGIARSSEVSGGTTLAPKICAPCCVVAVEGSLQLLAGVTGAAQATAVGSEGWLLPANGPGCQLELKMTTARSVRFFVNLGLGLVFYGVPVKCCAMSLSSVAEFQVTVLGGSIRCIVTPSLMVLHFGRVKYLT